VTLDKPSPTPVTVNWTTAPGTADANDFETATGELTFAPNDVSAQLTVRLRGDSTPETTETFLVRLTSATGAVLTDDTGFCTIADDDTSSPPGTTPQLRIGDVTLPEGNTGATPATVTVVLDQASETPVTAGWATADGSAGPNDYTAGSGELTFEPGATARQVTIPVTADREQEQDETFTVQLTGDDIAVGDGTVTIVDDDVENTATEVSITDTTVTEDAGTADFEVRLSAAATTPVRVTWATENGTATAPADYTGGTGEVIFTPGQLTTLIPVQWCPTTPQRAKRPSRSA
jgi:hypothetical protein